MSRSFSLLKSSSERALKRRTRCLHVFDERRSLGESSIGGVRPAVIASRRFASTAAARRPSSDLPREEFLDDEEFDAPGGRHSGRDDGDRLANMTYMRERPKADPEPLVDHLHRLFPPLEFTPTVATQMLTHVSAKEVWAGHNARLAFVGRRVLHSYLLLFLQSATLKLSRTSSPSFDPSTAFNFDLIAYRALFTNLLGEHVGTQWNLGRAMLWTPPVPKAVLRSPLSRHSMEDERMMQETPGSMKGPGLYKVQGTTVEGIMGGVFHQFGGSIAQRVFHTRLLPHILCPGTPFGLHDAFHEAALDMQEQMGGATGLLVTKEATHERRQATSSRSFHSIATSQMRTSSSSQSQSESDRMTRKRIMS
ncbi:hypothetical protein M0805_008117 [Coniferiporia weirii]|nr:hypothetical protein M0805_008117 [Coniferiporia weirii]